MEQAKMWLPSNVAAKQHTVWAPKREQKGSKKGATRGLKKAKGLDYKGTTHHKGIT
jgi:hypothetical protein